MADEDTTGAVVKSVVGGLLITVALAIGIVMLGAVLLAGLCAMG